MEISIPKDYGKVLFLAYSCACLWYTSLVTAVLVFPLILLSNMWLFYQDPPKAICMISNDKDRCLTVMGEVAENLGAERVFVYEDKGEDQDYEYLGEVVLQPEVEVDID